EPAALTPEGAAGLLRTMWRIRHFEERVGVLKRADQVHGLIHLSLGQEGVAASVCTKLRDDDPVYSGHRAHGHALAKGAPVERVLAELMGRSDGLCRGLGGSMHLVDVEHGFMGATGVVGGNIPAARGGSGPYLLECLTHRLRGHYEGDPGKYREAIAKADWQEKDPILRLQRHGVAEGWFSEDDVAAIERESLAKLEEAEKLARESPFPDEALMSELVYALDQLPE